jgi:hypothetical protein
MRAYGCCEGSDSEVDLQTLWTSVGAADDRCAHLSEMQVGTLGRSEEAIVRLKPDTS